MHLSLDEETEALRESVRSFAKGRIRPKCRDWDEAGAIPPEALNDGWGLSILAAGLPESVGGFSPTGTPSALTNAVALEEIAWGDLSYAQALFEPFQAAIPIALHGADAQKKELLPAFCGDKRPGFSGAWVEPSRKFDLATIQVEAKPAFAGATLAGSKAFVGPGEKTVVFARSGSYGWDGIDAYLVEGAAKGTREEAIGLRAAALSRVTFDGTPAQKLGQIDYKKLAARALTGSAAAAVGVSRAACEYAAAYAKERVAFGRPIAQYQSIAFMIADAATDTEAARLMTWKAAWKIDAGEDAMKEAALAFRFATDAAFRIADHGVQILGGHGVIRDHLSELFFRNARTLAAIPGAFLV
jgi:acyl-CoA dehydrogenase